MGRTEIEAYATRMLREAVRDLRGFDANELDVRLCADVGADGSMQLSWYMGDVQYDPRHHTLCAAHTVQREGNDIADLAADLATELLDQLEIG